MSSMKNLWSQILSFDSSTAMYTGLKFYLTYILAGFEPGILCYAGGCDDHHATSPEESFKRGLNVNFDPTGKVRA
jgi:hypothetical protein